MLLNSFGSFSFRIFFILTNSDVNELKPLNELFLKRTSKRGRHKVAKVL